MDKQELKDLIVHIREEWNSRSSKRAFKTLNMALRAHPEEIDLHLLHAQLWFEFGKKEKGLHALEKAEAINPDNAQLNRLKKRMGLSVRNGETENEDLPSELDDPEEPLVSAIVSTYNAESLMDGLMRDLLRQTIAEQIEIIVIDSGSQQNEKDIVERWQQNFKNIKYLRTERESVYEAWNRGIKMARGTYVTNANTDDRHRIDAFEVLAGILEESPEIAVVYSSVIGTTQTNETFKSNSANSYYNFNPYDFDTLKEGCYIGPMPMWRKDLHDKYGLFDPFFVTSGDYEFWFRVAEQGEELFKTDQILGLYADRENSLEKSNKERQLFENRLIRKRYHPVNRSFLEGVSFDVIEKREEHIRELMQSKKLDYDKVIEECSGAIEENSNDIDYLYLKSIALLRKGNEQAARRMMKQVLELFPEHSLTLNNLAILEYREGNRKKAVTYLERCVKQDERNAEAHINLADLYSEMNKTSRAREHLEAILEHHPMHIKALEMLRELLDKKDKVRAKYYQDLLMKAKTADLLNL